MHSRFPSLACIALGLLASAAFFPLHAQDTAFTPAASAASAAPARAATGLLDPEQIKDAGRVAINSAVLEVIANLPQTTGAAKRFAVLPIQGDNGAYFTLQVRNLFTQGGTSAGFELYSRDDAEWKSLLSEIAWGQNYADTMDAAAIQKFGKIKGVEGLLVGNVTGISRDPETGAVRVRINLQAFRVETGQILWSTEKSGTYTPPVKDLLDYFKNEEGRFSTRTGLVAGGIALGLILLSIIYGRLKFAARPR